MKITWTIDDKYIGKTPPQYTHIDNDKLKNLSEDEVEQFIFEIVQRDFEKRIYWVITNIDRNA